MGEPHRLLDWVRKLGLFAEEPESPTHKPGGIHTHIRLFRPHIMARKRPAKRPTGAAGGRRYDPIGEQDSPTVAPMAERASGGEMPALRSDSDIKTVRHETVDVIENPDVDTTSVQAADEPDLRVAR